MRENKAKLFNFENFWSILSQFQKTLDNQYRKLINRIFEFKTVQFTGLPFRIQKIAEMLTKNRKNWTKAKKFDKFVKKIIFLIKKVRKLSETQ